jgi:hypothetical protein
MSARLPAQCNHAEAHQFCLAHSDPRCAIRHRAGVFAPALKASLQKPTNAEGRHLRDAVIVDARDKLLVLLTRRDVDVEPTNGASQRALRPSAIFRPSRRLLATMEQRSAPVRPEAIRHLAEPLTAIRDALTIRCAPATSLIIGEKG